MPVEFVGMIGARAASELDGPGSTIIGGHIDRAFLREFARTHEAAGFDKVLVGYGSSGPDGWNVAAYAAAHTERLHFLLAHRPGFVAPTLAARKAATFDQLWDGRLALHIITGGNDAELQRDGDWLGHDERYARTGEYLDIMRRVWTEPEPFDYEGRYYRVRRAYSEVKPSQQPHVPLYYGGMSGAALAAGAPHANVFMMWGEPVAEVAAKIAEVRAAAAEHGRDIGFSVSIRPILGVTEEAAWAKAHDYLARILAQRGGSGKASTQLKPEAVGSRRLLEVAQRGEVHDERLWTAIAQAVGAYGNTTALVGTPEQVASSLLRYYDAGVHTLLIRGFEPLADARLYGEELIPLVRAAVAERDRQAAPAGQETPA